MFALNQNELLDIILYKSTIFIIQFSEMFWCKQIFVLENGIYVFK